MDEHNTTDLFLTESDILYTPYWTQSWYLLSSQTTGLQIHVTYIYTQKYTYTLLHITLWYASILSISLCLPQLTYRTYIGLNVHNNVDTYYYRKQVLFRNWSKKSSHIDIFFIFFMQGCVNKYRPSKTRVHLSYIGSISYVL